MIITRTPYRISFLGGGSDFKEFYSKQKGCVVSTAINKYVYVFLNKQVDGLIRVGYSEIEYVDSVDKIKHGIIRCALQVTGITKGVNISYMGDLMVGKSGLGLASSSALAVGVLHALYAFKGEKVTAEQLAQEACRIEIDMLSQPIGKQDQYIVAYGGMKYIEFFSDNSVKISPLSCKRSIKEKLKNNLLLLDTGITRLSGDILFEQREQIRTKKEKWQSLRKMAGLAEKAKAALVTGKLIHFGHLLHENWLLKKTLAQKISNNKIDSWYQAAREHGAVGGKITGAGGGGFLLLYAPQENHKNILAALSNLRPLAFSFEENGSEIVYNDTK